MRGLDTNIQVRYLTQDDPVQSRRATKIIERELTEQEPGYVCLVTMVEVVWVLDSVYDLSDREIAVAVEGMLQSSTLVIQNEQEVFIAMVALKMGRGSFADALVGALGMSAGCYSTWTLDRKAARNEGFTLISA